MLRQVPLYLSAQAWHVPPMSLFDRASPLILPFAGNPLDRAEISRKDEGLLERAARDPAARCLLFDNAFRLRCRIVNGAPEIDWEPGGREFGNGRFLLGLDGAAPRFARRLTVEGENSAQMKWIDVRSFGLQAQAQEAGIAAHAKALLDWHARHGYCPVCGARTESVWGGAKRVCENPDCRAEHFPRTDPVVIMLAVHGDSCLVGHSHKFTTPVFSTLAGFVDQGETIEEAVRRELMEEAGLHAGRVIYLFSQPWPFPSSLMIGCFAEALDRNVSPAEDEIAELRWITRDEAAAALAGHSENLKFPPRVAIAHHLLETFVKMGRSMNETPMANGAENALQSLNASG